MLCQIFSVHSSLFFWTLIAIWIHTSSDIVQIFKLMLNTWVGFCSQTKLLEGFCLWCSESGPQNWPKPGCWSLTSDSNSLQKPSQQLCTVQYLFLHMIKWLNKKKKKSVLESKFFFFFGLSKWLVMECKFLTLCCNVVPGEGSRWPWKEVKGN